MYLRSFTRLDLAYIRSKLVRYINNRRVDHWKNLVIELLYLRYTHNCRLYNTRYPTVLEGYTNVNWISNQKNSNSTNGYVFTLAGAAILWKSSKKTMIDKSTINYEFVALDKCGKGVEWLRNFLAGIPKQPKPMPVICIHYDSKFAIEKAQSNMYIDKS